jgi:hypothetical protein
LRVFEDPCDAPDCFSNLDAFMHVLQDPGKTSKPPKKKWFNHQQWHCDHKSEAHKPIGWGAPEDTASQVCSSWDNKQSIQQIARGNLLLQKQNSCR